MIKHKHIKRCARCGTEYATIVRRQQYCTQHCATRSPRPHGRKPDAERFWPKVEKNGPIPAHRPDLGPCWLWMASTTKGYGLFSMGGKLNRASTGAHIWSYTQLVGPVPEGLHLDHLCRVTRCVNPAHLEPVTCRENLMRGVGFTAGYAKQTHCVNGHPFDEKNTRVHPTKGWRECRKCDTEYNKRRRPAINQRRRELLARKKAQAALRQSPDPPVRP
jgi:hypothetical protein